MAFSSPPRGVRQRISSSIQLTGRRMLSSRSGPSKKSSRDDRCACRRTTSSRSGETYQPDDTGGASGFGAPVGPVIAALMIGGLIGAYLMNRYHEAGY